MKHRSVSLFPRLRSVFSRFGRFLQDVIDVTEETAEDLEGVLDDACARIDERFGTDASAEG